MDKLNTSQVRADFVTLLTDFFTSRGEDVQQVKSNKISFPQVRDGHEFYVEITVSVPKGTKDEAYDAYARAESYRIECEERAEKARKRAEEKARKMERDKKLREAKSVKEGE